MKKIKLPAEAGIHRYYWNREFDAPEFSSEELAELDAILQSIVEAYGNSTVRRVYARFLRAEDSDAKRKIIEPLTGGYLSFPIDDKYKMPIAKAGSYLIRLEQGDEVSENILVIREDPLHDPIK